MTQPALSTTAQGTPPILPTSDSIEVFAGRPTAVRLYGPTDRKQARPLVLHFHGGTFTNGSLDDGGAVARLLAAAGAFVASIDYPLAPAHPFPEAIDIGYAALEWLKGQRGRRHATDTPLFVAGEEAGGNLAAAVAMMARDRDPETVQGQVLVAPVLDPCMASASLRDASIGVGGCPLACGWQQYLSCPADISHPYAAPAAAVRLAGMPPALLVSFIGSPLHDDARRYAARLTGAGVQADELEVAGDPRRNGGAWPDTLQWQVRQFLAAPATQAVTTR